MHHTGCGDGETRDSRGGEKGATALTRTRARCVSVGSGPGRAIAHQSSTLADSEWEATRLRKPSPVAMRCWSGAALRLPIR